MTIQLLLALALILEPLRVSVAHAQSPTNVQIEVNFLLGFIEGSRCEFYRNGTWHDSKTAQAHFRDKYNYLDVRNLIKTTDDFIDKVATTSSLSGQPYVVSCNGKAEITSKHWLLDELVRFRNF